MCVCGGGRIKGIHYRTWPSYGLEFFSFLFDVLWIIKAVYVPVASKSPSICGCRSLQLSDYLSFSFPIQYSLLMNKRKHIYPRSENPAAFLGVSLSLLIWTFGARVGLGGHTPGIGSIPSTAELDLYSLSLLFSIHLQTNISKEWGFGPKGVNKLMFQESGYQLPYFSLATQNFRYFRNFYSQVAWTSFSAKIILKI